MDSIASNVGGTSDFNHVSYKIHLYTTNLLFPNTFGRKHSCGLDELHWQPFLPTREVTCFCCKEVKRKRSGWMVGQTKNWILETGIHISVCLGFCG